MPTPGKPSPSLLRWSILAAALAIIASANTLFNDLTYDDIPVVKSNPVVTGEAPFADIWTRDYWSHAHGWHANRDLLYRPLTVSTYRLNYLAGGVNPFGYHLVNVLLHAAVSVLVVVVAARIGCPLPVPAVAGALFAVMPIHVEAVAGVVGRAELLAALFTLLAICMVLPRGTGIFPVRVWAGSPCHQKVRGFLVFACLLAALLSKESGVAALVLVPLFAIAAHSAPAASSPPLPVSPSPTLLVGRSWLPSVLAAAIYLPLRYHALGGRLVQTTVPSAITNMLADASPPERFWGAWQLFGMYVAKTFWPATLCMDYSYKAVSLVESLLSGHVLLGIAAVAALGVSATLAWRRKQRGLAVAYLAIVIAYLPVSNTFFLMKTLFAERVWYVPSAFAAMVIAAAGVSVAVRITSWLHGDFNERATAGKAIGVLALVIMAALARSWIRNADWRDNAALFESAYRAHPTSAAVLYTYGRHLNLKGDPRGVALLERCVQITPGLTDAQVELGRAYLQKGEYAGALEHLQSAAMQEPAYPDLQDLLRYASSRVSGERRADLEQLRLDAHRAPDDLKRLLRLCEALTQSGAVQEALREFTDVAERFDGRAEFHSARAVVLMIAGRRDEAIAEYRRSLALDEQPIILAEMAMALLDRNAPTDAAEATALLERADQLAPDNVPVLTARAELFALQGRREDAAAIYRQVIATLAPGAQRSALEARLEVLAKE